MVPYDGILNDCACWKALVNATMQDWTQLTRRCYAAGQSVGILLTCSIDEAVVGIEVVRKILSQEVLFQLTRLEGMHQ